MKRFTFKNARFVKTAIWPKDYPILKDESGCHIPEIAVAGRSNVGKSSLLNHLFQLKGLVKTSSTPGKTQAINFFVADQKLCFVDLPGYGFAKVPISVRKKWGPMVQKYFDGREQLEFLFLLIDIRRSPSEEDIQLLEWAAHRELATLVILTKCDKVNQKEKRIHTKNIKEQLDFENLHFIHYSVKKNQGRSELMAIIKEALRGE